MNKKCHYYNKEHGKSIIKKGTNSAGHQKYLCGHCNKCFTETKGSIFYNRKIKEEDVKKICKELAEQKSIRTIEHETKHHRDTICKLIEQIALHSREVTAYLLQEVGMNKKQTEEMWRFIKRTKRNLSEKTIHEIIKTENDLSTSTENTLKKPQKH